MVQKIRDGWKTLDYSFTIELSCDDNLKLENNTLIAQNVA